MSTIQYKLYTSFRVQLVLFCQPRGFCLSPVGNRRTKCIVYFFTRSLSRKISACTYDHGARVIVFFVRPTVLFRRLFRHSFGSVFRRHHQNGPSKLAAPYKNSKFTNIPDRRNGPSPCFDRKRRLIRTQTHGRAKTNRLN